MVALCGSGAVSAKPAASTQKSSTSTTMNLYGRGRALRSRVVDTAASSEDDDDDDDDDNKVDVQTQQPPEKRRRSEPTAGKSRRSNSTRSQEPASGGGPTKHRASDGNLPGWFQSFWSAVLSPVSTTQVDGPS